METTGNLESRKQIDAPIPSEEAVPGTIEVSIADPQDIEAAIVLITKEYGKEGYTKYGHESPISSYLRFPGTVTFVAKDPKNPKEVVGTASMVFDNLPIETQYSKELNKVRNTNIEIKIAEVCQLATDREKLSRVNREDALMKLFVAIFNQSKSKGITNIVIVVNPNKHENFYVKRIGFEDLGEREIRMNPEVNNAPEVAKILDLKKWSEKELPKTFSDLVNKSKPH